MTTDTAASPGGRPRDDELTEKILQRTWDALCATGYEALDIQAVATTLGCAKSTIYRRWPTKAALAAAALERMLVVGDDPDTGDVAEDLLRFSLINVRNQLGQTAVTVYQLPDDVAENLWSGVYGKRQEQIITIIERAVDRGQLPVDTDVVALIDILSGFTLFRLLVRKSPPQPDELAEIIRALVASPPRSAS
ncbi:TetR/AcrR family transcriptional regulator [Mycetocola reblochoni]|uniref:Transcriptional regulator, TetR family n=2 Tax=Mycetocola reblochoni TaxID=331618 RepID=A0A1R4IV10_9MICO|nr:TetR/AcrR family transcriptional regulator [Mycetocola reblochoni]RLP71052.1 TetR/AcrR family transcriptional regulator [Mycetocola reblochoni]SJN23163.1 Transcriptional regulator, TetR family [Mycetocola reblochoni REB411]